MPWTTPTLRDVRSAVRDAIRGRLPGADASIPNSVLRVLSDAMGALCHLTLQYIDWLALQLMPDTAETEWLDRHGDIWLVNADGTTGRKVATLASGTATFTGVGGSLVPNSTQLTSGGGLVGYETTQQITIAFDGSPTPAPVRALDPGILGNQDEGTVLALAPPVPGIDGGATVVTMTGGVDEETDDELRVRVLKRIRQPPQGGCAYDYEHWALAVPGVTRAWCSPLEMGIGTVTIRVMMDDLRADNDGFPYVSDLVPVTQYIDSVRPVAVKDFWALAPVKQFIDVHIANLNPDNPETRGEIEASLQAMLYLRAKPGQTIYAAWKSYAIMSAPHVISFDLADNSDDVMPSGGHMAVLRDIYYAATAPS
jgi:uncharacterized phage protein gp47/JayE